jgi:hypothetical protein
MMGRRAPVPLRETPQPRRRSDLPPKPRGEIGGNGVDGFGGEAVALPG